MSCLIELCFIASIYVTGGIGVQAFDYDLQDENRTNDYGYEIGGAEIVVEFENNAFIKVVHFSGINTVEPDYGFNAVMIGAKIRFK